MKYDLTKFAPVKIGTQVFPLSVENEIALHKIVKELPVEWHSTTPKNFECQKGCFKCCSSCWFNEDELSKLPGKYHSYLGPDLRHVQIVNGKCVFYKNSDTFSCSLREHRPLRCRIYPFEPILDASRNSIVILAHDIMIWGGRPIQEPASLCYGLGNGKDVSKKASEQCREYLLHSILEQSFARFLWMGKTEDFIDKRALYRRQNPLYKTYKESRLARIQAVKQFGYIEFSRLMVAGLV